jgi:hypothetical protein
VVVAGVDKVELALLEELEALVLSSSKSQIRIAQYSLRV